jgi:signal transduction histidine kinase
MLIYLIFVSYNFMGAIMARQGLKLIPPSSIVYDAMNMVSLGLSLAALGNGTDLALWMTGVAEFKGALFPNFFFVGAAIFGFVGLLKLAKATRLPPGYDSVGYLGLLTVIYAMIPYWVWQATAGQGIPYLHTRKEFLFGLLYAFMLASVASISLKLWLKATGKLRYPSRLISIGVVVLSGASSVYASLFLSHTGAGVAYNPIQVLFGMAYVLIGLGVLRMGTTVVEIFSVDLATLPPAQPLIDIFGPSIGMRVYDTMALRVRQSEAALVRVETENRLRAEMIRDLEAEVARRITIERDLRDAKERAEIANTSKSQFLAMMSHELRTPLTTIRGYGELIGNPETSISQGISDQVRTLAQRICSSASHLQNLIDGLLNLTRLEAGGWKQRPERFQLKQILDVVLPFCDVQAREKELTVTTSIDLDPAQAMVSDYGFLLQILLNLIGNACKFTPRGTIHLVMGRQETDLVIELQDTGIGIPPDRLERIFEPFYQVSHGRTRQFGGVGLGLAIVKGLVGEMKGTIEVESRPGTGTKFRITLPGLLVDEESPS